MLDLVYQTATRALLVGRIQGAHFTHRTCGASCPDIQGETYGRRKQNENRRWFLLFSLAARGRLCAVLREQWRTINHFGGREEAAGPCLWIPPFPPCPSPLRHELRSLVDRLGIGAPAQNGNRIATRVKICGTRRTWRTEDLESNSPISGRLNENWRAGVMRRERTLVGAEVKFKLDDGCSLRLKQVMVL